MKKRFLFLFLLTLLTALTVMNRGVVAESFDDVDDEHPYSEAILYLKNSNIIGGYPDGTFKPGNRMNRAEFIKVIIGAAYPDASGANCFPDVKEEWFAPYVCEAKNRGIVGGYPDGTFKPGNTISFVETAKIMAITFGMEIRKEGVEQWYQPYVEALHSKGAIPESVKLFNEEIVRDEMAEMIYRIKAKQNKKVSRSYEDIKHDQEESYRKASVSQGNVDSTPRESVGGETVVAPKTNTTGNTTKPKPPSGGGGGGGSGGGSGGGTSSASNTETTSTGPTTTAPLTETTNTGSSASSGSTGSESGETGDGGIQTPSAPAPDTTPPTVLFTSPSSNATVSGTVNVTVEASDNVGITLVTFLINGLLFHSDSAAPYQATLDTTKHSNSSHTLSVKAKDTAGNETSATQSLAVNNVVEPPATAITGIDCGSTNSASPCTATQAVTIVDGITFTWNFTCSGGACQAGRFLDGSPWVRHPTGGNVSINSITPDDTISGLEKNPATGSRATTLKQGLYTLAGSGEAPYDASLDLSDELPYLAAPDNGVYVKAKAYTGGDCGYTNAVGSNCIDTYTALVVLANLPPDGQLGAKTFRPSSAGNTKLFVTIDDLDLSRLPQLSQITPASYSSTINSWLKPYPDFYTGKIGDSARRWTPHARIPTLDYAATRAEQNLRDTFNVLNSQPLTGQKLQAVYALTQYGIELYSGYMEGVKWMGGAGQHQGNWHPIVFFGALSRDTTIQQNIRAATTGQPKFIEMDQLRRNVNGIPIWGGPPTQDGCAQGGFGGHGRYWSDYAKSILRGEIGKKTCGDPYGYIDGPAELPGSNYANCCSSGVYVSMALLMKIWPAFNDVANNTVMKEFAERLMNGAGWWVSGDQCAIIDPRENKICSPYTESSANSAETKCDYFGKTWGFNDTTKSCVTIAEATLAGHPAPGPRWSSDNYHLKGRPSLLRGSPGVQLWNLFQ